VFYRILSALPRPLRPLAVGLYDAVRGVDRFNVPVVPLAEELQANVKLLADRFHLLHRLPKRGVVVELGVNVGDFSAEILRITQPKKLFLVDQWSDSRYSGRIRKGVQERFAKEIDSGVVHLINANSLDAASHFEAGSLDWIYIDTNHQYLNTQNELRAYKPLMKRTGYIAGHDYTIGNFRNGIRYGVVEAVNEFCNAEKWQLAYLTNEPHRFLSYGICAARELSLVEEG
jgi:hypothetical protein